MLYIMLFTLLVLDQAFALSLCIFWDLGGKANELGTPISIDEAQDHIFGMVLMNDWSCKYCHLKESYSFV